MAELIRRLGDAAKLEGYARHDDVSGGEGLAVEEALRDLWNLGRNLVLLWSEAKDGVEVLTVPHYALALTAHDSSHEFVQAILAGPKRVAPAQLAHAAATFGFETTRIAAPKGEIDEAALSDMVKRFGITYIEDRAVALFDIVGFSLLSPLEQVTQLNSLAYSVNSAHSKMLSKKIDISFARTTTGDGFYVWNRDRSIQANINLYHFMHLVLADNAIARSKSRGKVTPVLRTAFHVGGHYEYYQSEGLSPTIYSYIVGDVTIELARLIERAVAGQVVVGDFQAPMPDARTRELVRVDAENFIERTQQTLSSLEGLNLSGEPVDAIKCYLTGERDARGGYSIKKYQIVDKHGIVHLAYNAKINIYRQHAEPIFLGVQDQDLGKFGAGPAEAA